MFKSHKIKLNNWALRKNIVDTYGTPAVTPGANVISLFTMVIYSHSMVIPSLCLIKLYYLGNYHGMTVNYHGIKLFYNIGQKCLLSVSNLKYHGNFLW